MAQMILTKGLPASGKTTYAEELARETGAFPIGLDRLRLALFGGWTGRPDHEAKVLRAQHETVEVLLRNGVAVVVDDLNLDEAYVGPLLAIARRTGAEVVERSFLHVTLAECITRDAERDHPLGAKVIRGLAQRYGLSPQ